MSLFKEIIDKSLISRFCIFPKYLGKISFNSLFSETTLLFSFTVILSFFKISSLNKGFAYFQNSLFSVIFLFYIKAKKSSLVSGNRPVKIFSLPTRPHKSNMYENIYFLF